MKQPKNYYRYQITNVTGTMITAPFGESGFSIEWSLEDESLLRYSKELPAKLVFRDEAYQSLLGIEQTINRCDFQTITVERECNGSWVEWFTGRFSLNDANFDLYRCQVEIKLDKYNAEDCLQDNKSNEINLFDYAPNRQTVQLYKNNITITTVTHVEISTFNDPGACNNDGYWPGPGAASDYGYIMYFNEYQTQDLPNSIRRCYKTTKWARQEIVLPDTDPSPGTDWILIATGGGNNTWAKPAALYNCNEEQVAPEGNFFGHYKKECEILGLTSNITVLDNGMKLSECLQGFLNAYCPTLTVKSDFFQINPDTVSGINYVTGQPSKVLNLIVYQKSDVKRPGASGNATIAKVSWEKFITGLSEIFNLRWRVVGSFLRIEHVSFYSKTQGFDLTAPRFLEYVQTLMKYNYKTEQIPQREEFKFMEASAGDFAGLPIIYSGGCVTQGGRQSTVNHTAEIFTTDVELCLANPDSKSSIVDDRGLVLVAADPVNFIMSEPPAIGTGVKLNNSLGWAQLHRDYHRHYRPLQAGNMNGAQTTFLSIKPTKKGATLTIPLCCGDDFDPDNFITTPLGDGTVEKAKFSFLNSTLSIDLLYGANLNLLEPPKANNDVYTIAMDVAIDLDVISNDVPSPSIGVITGIEIVTPPAHGTAIIITGPKIRYTPNAGYFGDDNIVYRVTDGVNVPSNNALVAIAVVL